MAGVSGQSRKIMLLLDQHGELYGEELRARAEDNARVEGDPSLRLPRGSLYTLLGRLEAKGYIAGRDEEGKNIRGVARRYFQLTALGREVLRLSNQLAVLAT
jgi:DNA-binding PadR family transcriptional regulator